MMLGDKSRLILDGPLGPSKFDTMEIPSASLLNGSRRRAVHRPNCVALHRRWWPVMVTYCENGDDTVACFLYCVT